MPRIASLIALLALVVFLPPATAAAPEFRAMWVSRFEWPLVDPVACRARIDTVMQNLADANFNAVFFQVRGQADVLYPSPEEVWSPLIGGTDPGWDPLAYAIAAAHARGLQFHAYLNTHTCWQSVPSTAHALPADPNHTFYAHCNATDLDHRDWLHHTDTVAPVQFNESDYVWFAPGVPAYQAYVRRQVLYVVENYDVDGVHFDRIRTPGSNLPSQDPIGLARRADDLTNPQNLELGPWTADQITRTVRDIYAATMAVKPQIRVSAAVYPDRYTAPVTIHQDGATWAQTGALDILVPMLYSTGGSGSTWDSRLQAWLAGAGGRHVVAGHITSQGVYSLLDQITLTRQRGAAGNSVFSWSSFAWWNQYRTGPYLEPAVCPALPWKDSPTTGIICGHVLDRNGLPVVDAQITVAGDSYVALSSADGFYSFVGLAPGTYDLHAYHPDHGSQDVAGVQLPAGGVVSREVQFTSVPPSCCDFDSDWDVDSTDQLYFNFCLLGPEVRFNAGHFCLAGDTDGDRDVDLADWAGFQQHTTP